MKQFIFLTALMVSAAHANVCDSHKIYQTADHAIELMASGGNHYDIRRQVVESLQLIKEAARQCGADSGPQRTCTVRTSANGYTYLNNSPDIDSSKFFKVNDGAVLQFVAYETITYKGEPSEGIHVRVVSNPPIGPDYARSGQDLWEYKAVLPDSCRF